MLREGILAEDTGAGERQAGSQGEGCTTRVGWQWEEAMVVLFTGQRHTFHHSSFCPSSHFRPVWPLKISRGCYGHT